MKKMTESLQLLWHVSSRISPQLRLMGTSQFRFGHKPKCENTGGWWWSIWITAHHKSPNWWWNISPGSTTVLLPCYYSVITALLHVTTVLFPYYYSEDATLFFSTTVGSAGSRWNHELVLLCLSSRNDSARCGTGPAPPTKLETRLGQ